MDTIDPDAGYDDEQTCEAIYPQYHPFPDHRDAIPGRRDRHQAVYGFSWPVEASSTERT